MTITSAPENGVRSWASLRQGGVGRADDFEALFFRELRRLSLARIRSNSERQFLEPVALIDELYRGLLNRTNHSGDGEKDAFFEAAAQLIRRLLIEHAHVWHEPETLPWSARGIDALIELEHSLKNLALTNPTTRLVVDMKVFGQLTLEETAEQLDCSTRTAARHWSTGKQWLTREFATAHLT